MKAAFAAATLCLALLPRPASADASMQDVGGSIAKILGRVSSDWSWETTAPMVLALTRNPSNFEPSLAKGRALGALVKCAGRLDPLDKIPDAVKYSGQCEFAHGQARVYVGFGVGKDGQPVLIALGVFPNAGTEADYAEVAGDNGPLEVSGTVDLRSGSTDAASQPADAAAVPATKAIEPTASPAKAIEASEPAAEPAEPATKP